jgi:hypothetical protein
MMTTTIMISTRVKPLELDCFMYVWIIIINESSGVSSGAKQPHQHDNAKVKYLSKPSGYLPI